MREMEIEYTRVPLEEVIVDIAHHIERGYRIVQWSTEISCCRDEGSYTIRLVKY